MPFLALYNVDHGDPLEYLHVEHQGLDEVLKCLGEHENVIGSRSWISNLRFTHNFSVVLAKRAKYYSFNLNHDTYNQADLGYLQNFDAENTMARVS